MDNSEEKGFLARHCQVRPFVVSSNRTFCRKSLEEVVECPNRSDLFGHNYFNGKPHQNDHYDEIMDIVGEKSSPKPTEVVVHNHAERKEKCRCTDLERYEITEDIGGVGNAYIYSSRR